MKKVLFAFKSGVTVAVYWSGCNSDVLGVMYGLGWMGSEEIQFSTSVLRLLHAGVQRMPKIQLDFMTEEPKLSVKGLFITADGYLENS